MLTEDAVLDATRDAVLAVGARRTTLADVARRLGVSRPTIYRRWPDIDSLVADMHTREWVALVTDLAADAGGHPTRKTLVTIFVRMVTAIRDHPLWRKFRDVDPEVLLPYLFHRRGKSTDAMLATIEQLLRAAQAEGEVRDGDPALLARAVLLTGQSFVVSGPLMAEADPSGQADGLRGYELAALDQELNHLLDAYLAPGEQP